MATIQIRDIPDEAYEVIRRRAKAEHRSIQSYMLEHVLEFASRPTKAELLAEWDRRASVAGYLQGMSSEEIADEVRHAREDRAAELDARIDG